MKRDKLPASWTGLLLGLALAAGGVGLIVAAPEGDVSHTARYVPPSVEHVSPARSKFYGVILLLAGVGIFGFSLPRSGE
jgi:hypothetical protein